MNGLSASSSQAGPSSSSSVAIGHHPQNQFPSVPYNLSEFSAKRFVYAAKPSYQMDSIRRLSAITFGHMDGCAGSIAMSMYWFSEFKTLLVLGLSILRS
jgi:hypothetical protein